MKQWISKGTLVGGVIAALVGCASWSVSPEEAEQRRDAINSAADTVATINQHIEEGGGVLTALEQERQRLEAARDELIAAVSTQAERDRINAVYDRLFGEIEGAKRRVDEFIVESTAERQVIVSAMDNLRDVWRADGSVDWNAVGAAVASTGPIMGPAAPYVTIAGGLITALGGLFEGRRRGLRESAPIVKGSSKIVESVDSVLDSLPADKVEDAKKILKRVQGEEGRRLVEALKGKSTMPEVERVKKAA